MNEDYDEANENFDTYAEDFVEDTDAFGTGTVPFGIRPRIQNGIPIGCCRCCDQGELVRNGGMESVLNNRPRYWTFINSAGVRSENSSGNVHTGNASVSISSGSSIEQRIDNIRGCTVYNFSFFAKGLTSAVGLIASVIFITRFNQVEGAEITIRTGDMLNDGRGYDYYRTLTSIAPRDTIAAIIRFTATGATGQRLNIDDVSFSDN